MPISDDARRGREGKEIMDQALKDAYEKWKDASPHEKHKRAIELLSHIGAQGLKLKDIIIDEKEAHEIRKDAKL